MLLINQSEEWFMEVKSDQGMDVVVNWWVGENFKQRIQHSIKDELTQNPLHLIGGAFVKDNFNADVSAIYFMSLNIMYGM